MARLCVSWEFFVYEGVYVCHGYSGGRLMRRFYYTYITQTEKFYTGNHLQRPEKP